MTHERRLSDGVPIRCLERATGLEPAKSWLGKLFPYPTFRDSNSPSDLAVLKTNNVILANVLDEILEKRLVFHPISNSTLKHESRQRGDFRHVISGAGDENRTRVRCLGSTGNNHYTTPALAEDYTLIARQPYSHHQIIALSVKLHGEGNSYIVCQYPFQYWVHILHRGRECMKG